MYECPRCKYKTSKKPCLRKHFERKNVCSEKYLCVSIENCKIKLLNGSLKLKNKKIVHECKLCKKQFDRVLRLKNHYKTCDNVKEITIPKKQKPLHQFVYLLQEREFTKSGENIYKIGKTTRPSERIKGYPKGSILFLNLPCENCDEMEKLLIKTFDEQFINRPDVGREYYQGDMDIMIQQIILRRQQQKTNNTPTPFSIHASIKESSPQYVENIAS